MIKNHHLFIIYTDIFFFRIYECPIVILFLQFFVFRHIKINPPFERGLKYLQLSNQPLTLDIAFKARFSYPVYS